MEKKLLVVLIFLSVLLLLLWLYRTHTKSILVATYGLSDCEVSSIERLCRSCFSEKNKLRVLRLNDENSLRSELEANKAVDVIFSENGLSLERAKPLFQAFPKESFRALPSVFSNNNAWLERIHTATTSSTEVFEIEKTSKGDNSDGKNSQQALKPEKAYLYAFPLSSELLELILDKRFYKNSINTAIIKSQQITELLERAKSEYRYPICFSAADNDTLAFIISSFLTELDVDYTSTEFLALLKEIDLHKHLPRELKEVLDLFLTWERAGYMHNQWYDLLDSDVQNFLEFKQSVLVYMTISEHIKKDRNFMENFAQKKLLFSNVLAKMNLPVRLLLISKINKKHNRKKEAEIASLISYFQGSECQKEIAKDLNRVATDYSANTISAISNAADWIYTANSLLPTIDRMLFDNSVDRATFFKEIREYLLLKGKTYK